MMLAKIQLVLHHLQVMLYVVQADHLDTRGGPIQACSKVAFFGFPMSHISVGVNLQLYACRVHMTPSILAEMRNQINT